MKQNNNQKGTNTILVLIIIAIVLIAGVFFLRKANHLPPSSSVTPQTEQTIQRKSDLDAATNDLDNTDIDGVDNELTQLDKDAQSVAP